MLMRSERAQLIQKNNELADLMQKEFSNLKILR